MYLTFKDMDTLFVRKQGIQDDFLFYTVTDQADIPQPKGLFVPLNQNSGKLSEAISNGAVAAIWNKEEELPSYTPNHFPVFFTEDLGEAVYTLLTKYIEKLDGDKENKMETTNFKFSTYKLLNKNNQTYDIAVMLNKLTKETGSSSERRG